MSSRPEPILSAEPILSTFDAVCSKHRDESTVQILQIVAARCGGVGRVSGVCRAAVADAARRELRRQRPSRTRTPGHEKTVLRPFWTRGRR